MLEPLRAAGWLPRLDGVGCGDHPVVRRAAMGAGVHPLVHGLHHEHITCTHSTVMLRMHRMRGHRMRGHLGAGDGLHTRGRTRPLPTLCALRKDQRAADQHVQSARPGGGERAVRHAPGFWPRHTLGPLGRALGSLMAHERSCAHGPMEEPRCAAVSSLPLPGERPSSWSRSASVCGSACSLRSRSSTRLPAGRHGKMASFVVPHGIKAGLSRPSV